MKFSTVMPFLLLLPGGCASTRTEAAQEACQPPQLRTAVHWSPEGLARVRQVSDSLHSAAFMLITDGKLVAAWGDTTHLYRIHSIRKSLMSALYWIYVQKSVIDTSATLAQLGIDEKVPLTDAELSARVSDLLRARSGV